MRPANPIATTGQELELHLDRANDVFFDLHDSLDYQQRMIRSVVDDFLRLISVLIKPRFQSIYIVMAGNRILWILP